MTTSTHDLRTAAAWGDGRRALARVVEAARTGARDMNVNTQRKAK